MVSTLRHTEPRHPRFGLWLRRKAFSYRLWDAIQAAMGSEGRRSVDDRQVTFVSLIRLHEKQACRPRLSRSWKKQLHSLPSPNTMASLAHAYAISGQKEKAPKIPTPARNQRTKGSIPHFSVCLNLGWS